MKANVKKTAALSITAILTIAVIGYAYFRTRDFLHGPIVNFSAPENGSTVVSDLVGVIGTSKNISYLNLNGKKIFTDKDGKWSEKLPLSPGYNIIEADAKDRFGREVKKTLHIIYQEKKES